MDEFEAESVVLQVDAATARRYASIRHRLKIGGRPVPENDVWLSALALQHGLPIVSRDQHFDKVGEIERVAW